MRASFAVFTLITTRSVSHQKSARPTAQIPLRLLAATVCAALCVATRPATAHGFGQRYELPLPFQLYLGAAAAAIVVSFLIVGLFLRRAPSEHRYLRINLSTVLSAD